jgi:uncharacterized iron-regulated membrane protein
MAQDERTSPAGVAGYLAILAGLLLVSCGLTWSFLVPASVFWTEADANAFTEATAAVHAAISRPMDRPSDTSPESAKNELRAAKAKLEEVENRLESAKNRQRYGGTILSLIGLGLAITGLGIVRHSQGTA